MNHMQTLYQIKVDNYVVRPTHIYTSLDIAEKVANIYRDCNNEVEIIVLQTDIIPKKIYYATLDITTKKCVYKYTTISYNTKDREVFIKKPENTITGYSSISHEDAVRYVSDTIDKMSLG